MASRRKLETDLKKAKRRARKEMSDFVPSVNPAGLDKTLFDYDDEDAEPETLEDFIDSKDLEDDKWWQKLVKHIVENGLDMDNSDSVSHFCDWVTADEAEEMVKKHVRNNKELYNELLECYKSFEQPLLENGSSGLDHAWGVALYQLGLVLLSTQIFDLK